VTLLAETKCKKQISSNDRTVFQTQPGPKGGLVSLHRSSRAKLVKHLDSNLIWTTDVHDGALVHYIAVYIPPNDQDKSALTIRRLKWVLWRVFQIDKYS